MDRDSSSETTTGGPVSTTEPRRVRSAGLPAGYLRVSEISGCALPPPAPELRVEISGRHPMVCNGRAMEIFSAVRRFRESRSGNEYRGGRSLLRYGNQSPGSVPLPAPPV